MRKGVLILILLVLQLNFLLTFVSHITNTFINTKSSLDDNILVVAVDINVDNVDIIPYSY